MQASKIKMIPSSILRVPIQDYAKDFTFVVNGEEFRTSRIFADMISRRISAMHKEDATIDRYVINTEHSGDFGLVADLCSFREVAVGASEQPFIAEVIESLGRDSIEIVGADTRDGIGVDNVVGLLSAQSKFRCFYSASIEEAVEFASSNFFALVSDRRDELLALPKDIIADIVGSGQLVVNSEDELLEFVNDACDGDSGMSYLYEFVEFDKVSSECISKFIEVFDYSNLTRGTWAKLSQRLLGEMKHNGRSRRCRNRCLISDVSKSGEGLLSLLKKEERTRFDRLFTASQSSGDVYNLLEPNTEDGFTIADVGDFVEFKLEEPVDITGVKIFSDSEGFPKTFDIEINGERFQSIESADELNGANRSMTVSASYEKCRKVRIVNRGPNWDNGQNDINIRRIELLSDDARYAGGVFSRLVSESENQDPHKCPVFMSSSCFDFNTFHRIGTTNYVGTCPEANSWFQVELTRGTAVLHGFRLKRDEDCKMRSYKLICSDESRKPEEEWTTLIEINEGAENDHELLDIYRFAQPSPPTKYVRLIQTGPTWNNSLILTFHHFDLFGNYTP